MNETFISQAPNIIPVITDDRDFYVNLALAIITLFAVVIALLQEPLKKWLSRVKLLVEIRKTPPDRHQILLTNRTTGQPQGIAIYTRIRITNPNKLNLAQNTEVFIAHFWKTNKNKEERKEIETFLPMNLKWSHTGEIKTSILPMFYRYCDLGSFRDNGNGVTILILDTIVQPNPVAKGVVPNIIEPGDYIFQLAISGENVEPIIQDYYLKFTRTWSNDENTMLTRIVIEEL